MTQPSVPKRRFLPSNPFADLLTKTIEFVANITDTVLGNLQKVIGIKGMAYFFVLPNLLIFGIFILLPMVLNFGYAFSDDTGADIFLNNRPYVGTENFERLFDCDNFFEANSCAEDRFARAMVNTAGFVVQQVALMVVVSLLTALVLNRKIFARGFFRGVFFFPVLLSPIVVGLIWKWILQDNGLLNALLLAVNLPEQNFLTNADWAQFWVVMVSVWAYMGFYTLILLAGLQSIPSDLYEASSIDGASNWDAFWNITLPLLMPTLLVVLVLSLIRAVQVFDIVFAFTNGGPGTATLYIVQYIYRTGFSSEVKRFGVAAAASLVMASILVISTLVQLRLQNDDDNPTPVADRFHGWLEIFGLSFALLPMVGYWLRAFSNPGFRFWCAIIALSIGIFSIIDQYNAPIRRAGYRRILLILLAAVAIFFLVLGLSDLIPIWFSSGDIS